MEKKKIVLFANGSKENRTGKRRVGVGWSVWRRRAAGRDKERGFL